MGLYLLDTNAFTVLYDDRMAERAPRFHATVRERISLDKELVIPTFVLYEARRGLEELKPTSRKVTCSWWQRPSCTSGSSSRPINYSSRPCELLDWKDSSTHMWWSETHHPLARSPGASA